MDDDISRYLKNFHLIHEAYKKCTEEKQKLLEELKSIKNKVSTTQKADENQKEALSMSRKLIADQQIVISKLVTTREEIESCREEISKKNEQIRELREEKSILLATFQQEKENIIKENRDNLEDVRTKSEREIHRLKTELEKISANSSEITIYMNKRVEETILLKDQQINSIVSEYEKKLQLAYTQAMQLRNEYKTLSDKSQLNISAYKKRIAELEKNFSPKKRQPNIFPEDNLNFKNKESFNVPKIQKSFHILGNNEMEIEEIVSPYDSNSNSKVKRKLLNKNMDLMED